MNTDLRRAAKNDFKKAFFKLINNFSFWKNYGKRSKTQEHETGNNRKKKNLFGTDPNCHTTKFFKENLLAIKIKKKKERKLLNKPVYLALSMPKLSKTVIQEFCYNYVKPICSEKANVCYMETDSFIANIKNR